jgi:anti-sigma B factor antagonist
VSQLYYRRCLQVKTAGDVTVAQVLPHSLDEWNAEALSKELADLADQVGARQLQLDFDRVDYITSTGLEAILGLRRALRSAGGQLVLTNLNPYVHEVFSVTRLDQIIDVQLKTPMEQAPLCASV